MNCYEGRFWTTIILYSTHLLKCECKMQFLRNGYISISHVMQNAHAGAVKVEFDCFNFPFCEQGKWIKLHQEIKKCYNTQIPEWSYTTTGKDLLVCFTSWIWIGNLWYTVPSSSTSFVNMSHWTFPCGRWRCQACVVTGVVCTWSGDFTSMHKATTGSICTCTPLIIATKCLWSINPYICAQTWPSLSLM